MNDPGSFQQIEIELKYALDARSMSRIKRHPLLVPQRPVRKFLVSTYFDTSDHQLRGNKISLRVRGNGQRTIQSMKRRVAEGGGLFVRRQHEIDILGKRPDLRAIRPYLPLPLRNEPDIFLEPIFRVEFRRIEWLLPWEGSMISPVIDDGRIFAGSRSEVVRELEMELQGGDVAALFAVSRAVRGTVPLQAMGESKADRGYRLAIAADAPGIEGSDLPTGQGM